MIRFFSERKAPVLMILIFMMVFLPYLIKTSFALGEPDVIMTVGSDKAVTEGSMLNNVKWGWYPGQSKEGILRIINNSDKDMRINAFEVDLTVKSASGVPIDPTAYDYKIYALILKYGDRQVYPDNAAQILPFRLGKGAFIDLGYRLEMDKRCGNELQNSVAALSLRLLLAEQPGLPDNDDQDEDTPDDDDSETSDSEADDSDASGTGTGSSGAGGSVAAPPKHWAHDCIESLIAQGIIDPGKDGEIRPDEYITRAETAVLLGRALKLQELPDSATIYRDDDTLPAAARGYIAACYEAGVMIGYELYPGRDFRPNKHTPREEMCCVFVRSFEKHWQESFVLPFDDSGEISVWAYNHVLAAVGRQIMIGYPDNTFKPKQPMTRAEAFAIVCRLLGYHDKH